MCGTSSASSVDATGNGWGGLLRCGDGGGSSNWCMFLHEGYGVSGSAIVQAEDGSETRVGPGDGYVIQPGHDAWVVGDEPWVTVDFSQAMADYAKPT
jgi:hypothetical protein